MQVSTFILEEYAQILHSVSELSGHFDDQESINPPPTFESIIGTIDLPIPIFHGSIFEKLCGEVIRIFQSEPTLLELESPIILVGDLHGSFLDFLRIISYFKYETNTIFLFLGDIVDRGQFSLEILTILYSLKIKFPKRFYIIRGNHEFENMCSLYGFKDEIVFKMNKFKAQMSNEQTGTRILEDVVFKNFLKTFSYMPLAAVIDKKFFCVHGGLSPYLTSLKKIHKIERPLETYATQPIIEDIMWADVSKISTLDNFFANSRGSGTMFSEKQLDKFLANTGLVSVIRGHQFIETGVEYLFDNKLVTIFSASFYKHKPNHSNKVGTLVIGNISIDNRRADSWDGSKFDINQFRLEIEQSNSNPSSDASERLSTNGSDSEIDINPYDENFLSPLAPRSSNDLHENHAHISKSSTCTLPLLVHSSSPSFLNPIKLKPQSKESTNESIKVKPLINMYKNNEANGHQHIDKVNTWKPLSTTKSGSLIRSPNSEPINSVMQKRGTLSLHNNFAPVSNSNPDVSLINLMVDRTEIVKLMKDVIFEPVKQLKLDDVVFENRAMKKSNAPLCMKISNGPIGYHKYSSKRLRSVKSMEFHTGNGNRKLNSNSTTNEVS